MMPMLAVLLEPLRVPCLYLPLRVLLARMMGHHKLRVNLIGAGAGFGYFSSVLGGNEQEQLNQLDQDQIASHQKPINSQLFPLLLLFGGGSVLTNHPIRSLE